MSERRYPLSGEPVGEQLQKLFARTGDTVSGVASFGSQIIVEYASGRQITFRQQPQPILDLEEVLGAEIVS